jgi:hypothetical protein
VDERSWRLAVAVLASASVAVMVDAVLAAFEIPSGFWAVLSAFAVWLTTAGYRRNGRA